MACNLPGRMELAGCIGLCFLAKCFTSEPSIYFSQKTEISKTKGTIFNQIGVIRSNRFPFRSWIAW